MSHCLKQMGPGVTRRSAPASAAPTASWGPGADGSPWPQWPICLFWSADPRDTSLGIKPEDGQILLPKHKRPHIK